MLSSLILFVNASVVKCQVCIDLRSAGNQKRTPPPRVPPYITFSWLRRFASCSLCCRKTSFKPQNIAIFVQENKSLPIVGVRHHGRVVGIICRGLGLQISPSLRAVLQIVGRVLSRKKNEEKIRTNSSLFYQKIHGSSGLRKGFSGMNEGQQLYYGWKFEGAQITGLEAAR